MQRQKMPSDSGKKMTRHLHQSFPSSSSKQAVIFIKITRHFQHLLQPCPAKEESKKESKKIKKSKQGFANIKNLYTFAIELEL
ncbi:MAG: hypothetical protein H9928_08055 [Candidatus Phocaeicola excrementipullorum]|uniref:Uncharacterized protein n=1 Tax=Candidatus Phocaeicola excrementipullorum TaxID=2838731 RepID=A0A948TNH8_9BACT|nr:hypothetical protein [Candidatus Phocaeicola excrementipullorum]